MKRFLPKYVCLCLLLGIPACSTVESDSAQNEKAIAIVSVGRIDTNLLQRVSSFVSDNYWCPVRTKAHQNTLEQNADEEARELAKLIGPDDICLLALVNIPQDVKFREAVFQSQNVALLNIWALRPDDLDNDAAREQYARRVEKESMRAIGQLIGLKTCPMPRCALSIARTEQELDAKGRNLCPPCQIKAERILEEKGVILSFERHVPPFSKNKER